MIKFLTGILFLSTFFLYAKAQDKLISFDDPRITYSGRTGFKAGAAELYWPGASVKINFTGSGIAAVLKDQDTSNYYQVIVDENIISKIHPDTSKKVYQLAAGLSNGKHTLELFKRTEWDKGKTWFYGFLPVKEASVLPAPALPKRKIEFYGNSITCGYATEDLKGDSPIGYFENNYVSYAAITARHFNAQYSCIAKSGIGVLVSWFPLIMPEMYDRLDPTDSTSKWDFSKYTPDLVVINLFQNDAWITLQPNNPEFKHRFGTKAPSADDIVVAYKNLVQNIRDKYPKAKIICALGSMDATREGSPWPGYIEKAVKQLNDKAIYTHFFPYKNTPGHPKVPEQQKMANDLIAYIDKTIKW
ncbi:SGNH/GDSL hydrolase family protein [Mucilaginibacter arboris]|uniref:Electron transporter RnfD n=1 Tax=Mucilaginibacter arboris TaxID=2682090 RepID=A0A7K1T0Q2_9SPHI|nr:SGNH/GDSL hydrolase family protein [Mucilaginibacter arboris]MVN23101.1 electron transporter RnfD [Mucilaginibacter arboris]